MKQVKCIFEQIAEFIMDKIDRGEFVAGDSLGSEITLAEKYGVSRGTISKALKILEVNGYINDSQRGKKRVVAEASERKIVRVAASKKIAILFPDEREYFVSMKEESKRCSQALGWDVHFFFNFKVKGEWTLINSLIDEKYDGVLIMPDYQRNDMDIKPILALKRANIPFVLLCRPPRNLFCDAVYFDDYFVSFQMAELLKRMHCKEIIHITDNTANTMVRKDRLDGYYDSVIVSGQDKVKVFDIHLTADRQEFEYYLLHVNYKIGIHIYNNILFQAVKHSLDKVNKKKGRDYDAVSFSEKDFGDEKDEMLVYVPKEKIMRKAINILNNRITSEKSENIVREIFCIDGLHF